MQQIKIAYYQKDGVLCAQTEGAERASLSLETVEKGARLAFVMQETPFVWVKVAELVAECLIYVPDGSFDFIIPEGEAERGFDPATFAGPLTVTVRAATADDLAQYRNLALNPLDRRFDEEIVDPDAPEWSNPISSVAVERGIIPAFPHAYANRVTRNEGCFYARNAIDGISNKGGHGSYPFQSWGGAVHDDLSFTIYFGRTVLVDKLVLCLRSDYALDPEGREHDTYWHTAMIEFSDGWEMEIHPEKTGDGQEFPVEPRKTDWVKLKRLDPVHVDTSLNFAALNEMEVWGKDLEE